MVFITIQRNRNIFFCQLDIFLSCCFFLSTTEYFHTHAPSGFFYQPDMNFSSYCGIVIPSFGCRSYSFPWKWEYPFWCPFSSHSMLWLSDRDLYNQNFIANFYFFSWVFSKFPSGNCQIIYYRSRWEFCIFFHGNEQHLRKFKCYPTLDFQTPCMFGYTPNPEGRRLCAWMFGRVMEIVKWSQIWSMLIYSILVKAELMA